MYNFWQSVLLLIVLVIFIIIFGAYYGVIYDNLGGDLKVSIQNNLSTYFWVCAFLVGLLGLLSVFWIRQIPNALNPYLMVVTHISLLLSLTSVSFATMTKNA